MTAGIDFEHGGIRYTTTGIGRFDTGEVAELFLNAGKYGTDVDTNAGSVSLALQHGCPAETLRRALMRNADGLASGPIAQVLDRLADDGGGQ